ncbi:DUF3696 domain-containing protein [Mucilaginibacter celer]|uniref:DUF3696 domain-containing protein n=1 Tax=Mucilaginibacter celer TaxID=2305508 RepID=A0A494VUN8_9SPHI|nr:DUF3696 domain-containing protein [Mucilaginibacter celer]AYL95008.1 DUF3696 domain-containing protein [Mucilaginibacter celer]
MFESIELKNFKGFKEAQIDIGDLTILTGANSSGKSALTNSILSILQSDIFRFELSINGDYVNLGDYADIINNRDTSKDLTLAYTLELIGMSFKTTTVWSFDKLRRLPKMDSISILSDCLKLTATPQGNKGFQVKIAYDPQLDNLLKAEKSAESKGSNFEKTRNLYLTTYGKRKDFNLDTFNEKIEKSWQYEGFFENLENEALTFSLLTKIPYQVFQLIALSHFGLDNITKKTSFIGSLRNGPERTYYENSKSEIKVGPAGENFSDIIILWDSINDKKLDELKEITKSLGIAEDIKANRLTGGRYEIQIKPQKHSPFSSMSDVGFGVSQFLPIIISDIDKGEGSSLFIAQPETHLHPSVQADFCDYIIEQINSRKKSYFIETHSEYFLNRLRLNIVNNKISTDKVKVYYLINKTNDTEIHEIKFQKNGAIENAPEEFFKTYLMDTMDIALNAINNEE